MSEPELAESTSGGAPHADALVDALLAQMAAGGGGDDEAFLARAEAAVQADGDAAKIVPGVFRRFAIPALAAAAALALGLGVWFLSRPTEETAGPPIAGDPAETVSDGEGEVAEEGTEPTPSDPLFGLNRPIIQNPDGSFMSLSFPHPEILKRADEAALRGSQAMADGDHQGAIDQYRAALDLLSDAPIVEPRRLAYVRQFSRASVLLAVQRAEEGRYPESIALVEEVLQPSIDPGSIDAHRLLERLEDPGHYSPALSPSNLERVRRVKLAMRTAQGFIDLGDHNRADREYRKALNDEPYSTAARRGLEGNDRHKMNYFDATYDHTRARMLREVAKGWESPVPTKSPVPQTHTATFYDEGNATSPPSPSAPRYAPLSDGIWASPLQHPLSTFSVDVDTAAWANLRAMVRGGARLGAIPKDAVRIEELVNYFPWSYPQPEGEDPFAFAIETGACPWNAKHQLLRIGIQGREIPRTERPPANLVFLLDVSGSMNQPDKLPLVKRSLALLVEELDGRDRIAIVTYAGSEGVALPSTAGSERKAILDAIDRLEAGGSTNGGAGIRLAYRLARERFAEGGVNRVLLCTDGDFNVGVTGTEDLIQLAEAEAKGKVHLSVLGFGRDNLNDAMLETLTNRCDGNYFHIDGFREARKVLLGDLMGTLVTIAKDVKIQVEFNPAQVASYRLIGYANRRLENEDFANDEVDAGEVGAGHTVTALYEIVPQGAPPAPAVGPELRYQKPKAAPEPTATELVPSDELALLKLRYKQPDRDESVLMTEAITSGAASGGEASDDFRFAAAVALFGMILREQDGLGGAGLRQVIELAKAAKGPDPEGWRAEFVDVVRQLQW